MKAERIWGYKSLQYPHNLYGKWGYAEAQL
jgi:hypothetical protein